MAVFSNSAWPTARLMTPHFSACSASYVSARKKISRARLSPIWRASRAEPYPASNEPTLASTCLNLAYSRLATAISATTMREWPPPVVHPGMAAMIGLGVARMRRCTSRMWRRPSRPFSMRSRLASVARSSSPEASCDSYWYPSAPRIRWSPPEQKAYPPSCGEGPLPVRMTAATSGVQRAASIQRYNSSTVWGRKALRMVGRSKAMRTTGRSSPAGVWSDVPRDTRRWKVMSVSGSPGRSTSRQRAASKMSETNGRVLTRWKLPLPAYLE